MSKKVIVLADNSYTIRRIVELSFSEIENIEVRSFENGSGIKEKLLQLAPAVVIVDVKLPELNGYDVCRFINETPALKNCRVFLMKGSFEPVDNEMIKNLKYEDIVTKPFDSNALVGVVMKIVNQEVPGPAAGFAAEGPTTFPEDFPEIETELPESEDISFSDIRGEMDAPSPAGRPAASAPVMERDEILPSEEITQGTQPLKDNLMPQEAEESIKNPFEEEPAFEEINMAPPTVVRSAPMEYELEPPLAAPAAPAARDVATSSMTASSRSPTRTPPRTCSSLPWTRRCDRSRRPAVPRRPQGRNTAGRRGEALAWNSKRPTWAPRRRPCTPGSDLMAGFKAAADQDREGNGRRKSAAGNALPPGRAGLLAARRRRKPRPKPKPHAEPPVAADKIRADRQAGGQAGQTIRSCFGRSFRRWPKRSSKQEIDKIKVRTERQRPIIFFRES